MSRNILFRRLLTISLLVVVTFIWCAASTSHASADCGNPPKSSCISCHALEGHVEVMGEWNSVHLHKTCVRIAMVAMAAQRIRLWLTKASWHNHSAMCTPTVIAVIPLITWRDLPNLPFL